MKPRTIMSEEPIKELESRVLEERNRLHDTAGALKDKIAETRATLSVVGQVKKHFITAFLGVSLLSFAVGYGLAAMLAKMRAQ